MPGPVRSREHLYGLPTNTAAQQREADRGTLMACTSVDILDLISEAGDARHKACPATLENPPETDRPEAASAYLLPEVAKFCDAKGHGPRAEVPQASAFRWQAQGAAVFDV